MDALFWIIGIAFAGYVLWVLMTSGGRKSRRKRNGDGGGDSGGGWFGGGWDGGDGDGGGGGD